MALDFEDYEVGKAPPYSAEGFTTGAITALACIHAYDESVATVDAAGNVTLVGTSSTSIRAQYTQNGIVKAVSIPVTVQ